MNDISRAAGSDEQMLLVVHKHWASFATNAIPVALPGIVILGILLLFRDLTGTADISAHAIVTLLVPLSFLILWTILALLWTNYYLDMLVITDRRIFYTSQVNFAQRFIRQWDIPDIRNVAVRFGNLFESFFNYGSIEIEAAGEMAPVRIGGIPDPQYVSAVILKQDDRYGEMQETAARQRELLHFLSHEVKGHLAKSKAAFAAIVEGDLGPVSSPLHEMAGEALADSQKGVDTVMSILDNSDLSRGNMRFDKKIFDLSAAVLSSVEEFRSRAEGKGLALRTSIDADCRIEGDEEKIKRHVVRNLIENAIRYTPAGQIDIGLQKGADTARFSVADTGVGIAADDMQKLFTEGGRGEHAKEINPDSTGYGLFVAKQVVDAHGGRIWARSAGPGSGSTFSIEFPLA